MIRSIETSPPHMPIFYLPYKVMDEEKVDEEGNGFIQSFMLQQRQNANRPPESRFMFHSFFYDPMNRSLKDGFKLKKHDNFAQERLWH